MNMHALLTKCLRSGVRLDAKNGELCVHFDGEFKDPELLALLREYKQDLLQHLGRLPKAAGGGIQALPAAARTRLPASMAQCRMWLLDQLGNAGGAYNMVGAYRLRGAFDAAAMQATLDALVARHEALRTVFASVDGEVRQFIQKPERVPFEHVDLSGSQAEEQVCELHELLARENGRLFDLANGPLLRATCIDLGEDAWVLVLNVHHIACDGWSIGILEHDISALYAAAVVGGAIELPAPAIQYGDYVASSEERSDHAAWRTQIDYWKENLEGMPPLHGLPLDRPRPPIQAYSGGTVRTTMLATWLRTVLAYCQANGATLFMYMHAALAAVLGIYANERDIAVGFPVAGRRHKDLEATVGLFANTLVLRTRLESDRSFSDMLASSRQAVIKALEHQDVPYDALVDTLRPERSLSHNPLTQIFLALQSRTESGLRLEGLDVTALDNTDAPVKFDLQVEAVQSDDGLVIHWRFNRSLFDEASVARMAASFARLLETAADQPELKLFSALSAAARIGLLAPAERTLLLETWNRTEAPYPAEHGIHQLFEDQVRRTPEATALVFEEQSLSYAALNAQANRLAHYLVGQGVRPDERVAICVERSLAMVVGLLAILKAGGAYVPLDPGYPAERLGQVLGDADPVLVLADASGQAALGEAALRGRVVLELDRPGPAWSDHPATDPDARALGLTSRHLAYVIYTSGSTGTPKGVMVEHRSLGNLVIWHGRRFELGPDSRSASSAGFAFDASTWEMWPILVHGGSLLLPPRDAAGDILPWWRRQSMDTAFLVTPLASVVLSGGALPNGLRTLLIGGDRLPSLPAGAGLLQVVNNYGPTETTVVATSGQLSEIDALVHIGRPIANTRLYLLDAYGQPVPLGAVGELYIGGVGVARGYLNRPELTAERFLADPFCTEPEARMYRTGDLARYLPDGNLVFLGRNDHQVKLRGFRIELGEIEARLVEHPDVREAVVLALGEEANRQLVAYVVRTPEAATDDLATILRTHLAACLPEYMVPAAFVSLDALPLTPNGKLDRRALPDPSGEAFARRAYAPPQGEIEIALTAIWQELLGIERVGRHDHFFELGGHSLLAVRLLSRLGPAFAVELPLTELFSHPVLSELAAAVIAHQGGVAAPLAPITPTSREGALPLSFAQQRLWFLAQLDGVSTAYHLPAALHLQGALDVPALHRALDTLLARHEALRTVFVAVDGQPQVQLQAIQPFTLIEQYLQGHADPARMLAQLSREEARAPFDLAHGPLIRGRLIRLAPTEHMLLLTLHHIVSDGWSRGILVNEFSALYGAFVQGRPDPLPPLAVQYPDYAAWQHQWLTEERLAEQLEYWRNALAGAPVLLALPTDRPRSATPSYAGASLPLTFDIELTQALKRLSQRHDTTLFMLLVAAWAVVLARLSGQEEVVIGTPSANRGRREIEPLVGLFVNTLALRIDVSDAPSVPMLLARVRTVVLGAQDHQDVPFEQVVEQVNPPRRLEHAPIFQVLFAWQNNDLGTLDLPGLRVDSALNPYDRVKFDLELNLSEVGDSIQGSLDYATDLFDAATMERQGGYLLAMLKAMAAQDEASTAQIDLLAPAERTLLLETWNRTEAPYPAEHGIHQLFEDQVRRTPEATALVFEEQSLSYAALNAQANRLAHYLVGQGVRPDERVAICVERSLAMVVGLLAILKAGGAYVPLDPGYPAERLGQVLGDADPVLVLADASGQAALGEAALRGRVVLELDRPGPAWSDHPATDPDARALGLTSRHLAYVIYTSGSTGTPKGVMVEHRSLGNLVIWHGRRFELGPDSRSASSAGFAFDASTWEMWPILVHGGSLLLPPRDAAGDILPWWRRQSMDTAFLVTPLASVVLSGGALPNGLRTLLIGGDRLPSLPAGAGLLQVVNNYGPTETTVVATSGQLSEIDALVHIGRPIANTRLYLLDAYGQPVPLGAVGELYIGGVGVARGYLNRPELTAERFLADPFCTEPEARMYRTGDLARYLPDGNLVFLGRNDHQVKLRGFRIELGEIEARLVEHPDVREAVVLALGEEANRQLVAYVVRTPEAATDDLATILRTHLAACLPEYMVPAAFVSLDALPLTPNGKLDRRALPDPGGEAFARRAYAPPQGHLETTLAALWQDLLKLEQVGIHDQFFEVGGNSLHTITLKQRILEQTGHEVAIVDLFTYPTIAKLAHYLRKGEDDTSPASERMPRSSAETDCAIAIIGMAGRFPDAHDVDTFWANIASGKESLRFYSKEELHAAGLDPMLVEKPNFVPVRSLIEGVENFDADYFGFSPREAEVTDPQQRILLECAHEALEMAGYGDAGSSRPVGVFVGVGENQYMLDHLLPQIDAFAALGDSVVHANSKDFAATRISYKLNLSGPSVSVNTACSTSLVAIHQACSSLAQDECRMALAGAVSIGEFGPGGYLHQEGDISSPDGHCRAFDRDAKGTRRGNGAGIVVLKRLDLALADGDTIHAVIKGSAINNDGSDKVGYTAPSIAGQARVIEQAYRKAGISPATIQYVEAHGTGTVLGDPVEMRALSRAFTGNAPQTCAIGTVKPNVGHMDTAAGVAGLIKTVQALKHRQLPPSLHYKQANPQIDFANSPFYVNTQLRDWPGVEGPRRAGVSSFGIGGTNAHVVVEEPPANKAPSSARPTQLLSLSARSPIALQAASARLADHLQKTPAISLADVAYTLQTGRTAHAYRRVVVCETTEQAVVALASPAMDAQKASQHGPSLIWMFPGQGSQHVDMARELYTSEPVFREQLDMCAEILRDALGVDVRDVFYPPQERREEAARQLRETWLAQPVLFAMEYSLATLLQSCGLAPEAMIGHSLGEYVAACVAGVFSLQDGLKLVVARSRLMQQMAAGRMLSVLEEEGRLLDRLAGSAMSVSAVNDTGRCVVSGPLDDIDVLREQLLREGIESRELETSHAFHSAMMEPMLDAWRDTLRGVSLNAPSIPCVSSLTGDFLRAEQARDPEYWVRHLRDTVRFGDGLETLLSSDASLPGERILVEVGSGQALSGLSKRRAHGRVRGVVPLLNRADTPGGDARSFLQGIGQLWLHGATIDWRGYHTHARRQRVPLPTYPFERRKFWVDAPHRGARIGSSHTRHARQEDWFYAPLWRMRGTKAKPHAVRSGETQNWIVMTDRDGIGVQLAEKLRKAGHRAVVVWPGDTFERLGDNEYAITADNPQDYARLVKQIERDIAPIHGLVHLWTLDKASENARSGFDYFEARQRTGYHSLMFAIGALATHAPGRKLACHVATRDVFRVVGCETLAPEHATIIGLCKVAPQEYPNLRCQHIDFYCADEHVDVESRVATASDRLLYELVTDTGDKTVAFRGSQRWTQTFEKHNAPAGSTPPRIKQRGVYVITGGLGNVGYALAEHLASMEARLVLIVRDELPDPSSWDGWIAEHAPDEVLARKLSRLRKLEAKGAKVLVCKADVTDEAQMTKAFEQAETCFGSIDGVIHCAGNVRDSIVPLAESTLADCRAQFLPKVKGVMVLERVLERRQVDFCVLMSSLSAILGGLGFASYAAANAYLDAFATSRHAQGDETWLSINWDGWHVDGSNDPATSYAVTGPEGAKALDYALSWADVPQLVHSTGDLKTRHEKWIDLQPDEPANMRLYVRDHDENFQPPSDAVELQLARIWQQLLGLEGIGIADNFFMLGGDSLLVTRLLTRIREAFPNVASGYSMRDFFEAPTIKAAADRIRSVATVARLAEKRQQILQSQQELDEGVF